MVKASRATHVVMLKALQGFQKWLLALWEMYETAVMKG